jgi:nucleoid DNA-binding protein
MAKAKTKAVKSKPGKGAAKTTKSAKPGKPKRMTKSQIYQHLAEKSGLTRKQVSDVFDHLNELVKVELAKPEPGEVVIPNGLLKIKRKLKEATPEKPGKNPKTGEPMTIPAKPRRYQLGVRALKTLKDMIPPIK